MIEYRLLGPVEVLDDGKPADSAMKWRKNLALLVYLGRSAGKPRTRDHLVGLLWADKPDASARHSLREALRVIRKRVGKEALIVDGEQVRLAEGAFLCDIDRFDRLEMAGKASEAWSLVRGEFMEGFSIPVCSGYESWLAAERKAFRDRSEEVARRVVTEYLNAGNLEAAARVLDRAVRLAPDSEQLARLAMKTRALSGDRAGAIKAFDTLVAALSQYGATPDHRTEALVARVRRGKEWRVAEKGFPPSTREARRTPLIGRAAELGGALRVVAESLASRQPAAVIIVGDPGAGKSRLATEIVTRAELSGAVTAIVRAVQSDRNEPWSGLIALARGGLLEAPGLAGAEPAALAAFAELLPEWRERFRSVSFEKPLKLGRALEEILRAVTEDDAALLCLDDAHLLDRESLETLVGIAFRLNESALVILMTVNSNTPCDVVDGLRAKMGREMSGAAFELAPLGANELRQIASWALPEFSPDETDRVARRLLQDTAGLPVLAVEMLNAVSLGLELERFETAWPSPLQTLDQTMPGDLPDAIVASIRVGFRRLSDDAQEVVSIVAVGGEGVTFDQLVAGSCFDRGQLEKALDESEWQRWLAVDSRGYSFVARIVREVVLSDLVSVGKRQRIGGLLGV